MIAPGSGEDERERSERLGDQRSCEGAREPVPRQQGAQRGERFGHDPVVGPVAALLALDEARFRRTRRWWLTVGWLRPSGSVRWQRCLAVRLGLDQAEQPQPRRVGDDLQGGREPLGFAASSLLQRSACRTLQPRSWQSSSRIYIDTHRYVRRASLRVSRMADR